MRDRQQRTWSAGSRRGAAGRRRGRVVPAGGGAAAVMCVALSLVGCGATPPARTLAPSQPWSDALSEVFDDGFDFVAPLRSILGTAWFDEYGAQLERRLEESDVVAVVELKAVAPADEDRSFGGLDVVVLESLVGEAVRGDLLRLDAAGGSAAAERIEAEEARLREVGRFVAYVRLYADELGATRSHWHLSPDDSDLRGTIRRVTRAAPP